MFENHGHIHVYRPGEGEDNPDRSDYLQKHKFLINLVLCCKFSNLMTMQQFFHSNT